jgi:hypothetical protein
MWSIIIIGYFGIGLTVLSSRMRTRMIVQKRVSDSTANHWLVTNLLAYVLFLSVFLKLAFYILFP